MSQRILLADDSNVAQRMGKEILSAEGFEVFTVSNGQAALKKLHDFNPDLIIADIFMPGTTGYELCAFVKADPQLRQVPVILLVGAMEPYDPEEGRKVKADGMITKPLQSSTLLGTVKKLLASAQRVERPVRPNVAVPSAVTPAAVEAASTITPGVIEAAAPVPAVEEPEPETEEPIAVSFEMTPEPALNIPPQVDEHPSAAFEELLDSAEPPQPTVDLPAMTPDLSETASLLSLSASEPVAAATDTAAGEPASDVASEMAFPFTSLPVSEETTEQPFAITFPSENATEEAQQGGQAAETSAQDSAVMSQDSFAGDSTIADDEAPEPEISPLAFLSGSSTALEQTSADPGVLSIITEVSQAEAGPLLIEEEARTEEIASESAPVAPINWTVEPAEVMDEDRNRFEAPSPTPDWAALTQMAEFAEAPAPADELVAETAEASAPDIAEPPLEYQQQEPASTVPPIETAELAEQPLPHEQQKDEEQEAEQQEASAAPPPETPEIREAEMDQQQEYSEAPPPPEEVPVPLQQPAAIDTAHIEKLVRESIDQLMPQIVDRIVRSVEIVLRREQD